jgi:hypothetical protein
MRRLWLPVFVASVLLTYSVFVTGEIVSGDNIVQYYQTAQIADRHGLSFSKQEVADMTQEYLSRAQLSAIDTPRQFLWFRGVPSPRTRWWAAVAGLAASAWSLANVHRQ